MTRRKAVGQENTQATVLVESLGQQNAELSERLAALEFALESLDWRMLTQQAEQEFSREGLRLITELARVMKIKNPIIKRGVEVQRLYVWGQGVSVAAHEAEIQAVLDAFDADNAVEMSHQARGQKEEELQTDGNLFFVYFINRVTGRVRVRSIPFNEIIEKICDPDDAKTCWYYKRSWVETTLDANGVTAQEMRLAYYPDWKYTPVNKPPARGGVKVNWDSPIYHVRVGGFSDWKFGLSEVYAAIDWARAYKEFLEDWASIVRAYRKFAFQLTTPGGKGGIAAAKAKLGSTLGTGSETNPAPAAGSTFIAGEGTSLTPVRTSGATVSAEDGRRLLLMVAAAFGLPETFFGDSSVGTLATAKSLDRPTELMMLDRRTLWTGVLRANYEFVLFWAVKAVRGALSGFGRIEREVDGDQAIERVIWNTGVDSQVDVNFPPLLEHDIERRIQAIVQAGTLDGKAAAGTMDRETLSKLLLVALGVEDVEGVLERLRDEDLTPRPPSLKLKGEEERPQSEALMVEAVRELRDALANLRE